MSMSSLQLDAFLALSRCENFSRAARSLHITQSALSQRIKNLEDDLGLTLFKREPNGAHLTDAGFKLLRYCQIKDSLELELLSQLKQEGDELAGVLRVGAFSSVLRSVVMPALAPLIRDSPHVLVEFSAKEMRDLPNALRQGQAEFVLMDEPLEMPGIESQLLGFEESVMIESRDFESRIGGYLDHDDEDVITERFLRLQGEKTVLLNRCFLDDIYGLVDGVRLGFGRAVIPRHLLKSVPGLAQEVREIPGFEPLRTAVFLNYFAQPYYTSLHLAAREALLEYCPPQLEPSPPRKTLHALDSLSP